MWQIRVTTSLMSAFIHQATRAYHCLWATLEDKAGAEWPYWNSFLCYDVTFFFSKPNLHWLRKSFIDQIFVLALIKPPCCVNGHFPHTFTNCKLQHGNGEDYRSVSNYFYDLIMSSWGGLEFLLSEFCFSVPCCYFVVEMICWEIILLSVFWETEVNRGTGLLQDSLQSDWIVVRVYLCVSAGVEATCGSSSMEFPFEPEGGDTFYWLQLILHPLYSCSCTAPDHNPFSVQHLYFLDKTAFLS